MRKLVLTSEECEKLIPHWYELDMNKLNQLGRVKTRKSNFDKSQFVMSSEGILITDKGYILNGKHRACWSVISGLNTEAYEVKNCNDILHHTPLRAFGDLEPTNIVEAFLTRFDYISLCQREGIYSIKDLVQRHLIN